MMDTWLQDVVVWMGRLGSHSTGLVKVSELLAAWGLTGARRSPLGKGKNKASCCAKMHPSAVLFNSYTFGHLSLPLLSFTICNLKAVMHIL